MGPRRVSLRPPPPPLGQRVLVLAVLGFSVGSLVCLHSLTGGNDWSIIGSSTINFRYGSGSPVLDHVIAKRQEEPSHEAQRAYLKEHASVLSADQSQVVAMAKHAWDAYRNHSSWLDLLDVTHQRGVTLYDHDVALTAVDSLDTLLVLGLHDEFDEASNWIKTHLRSRLFASGNVSFSETSTRLLGGLLAAYHLSGDAHLLQIASELGDALEGGFTCGIFVPCRVVDLERRRGVHNPSLAEASSFQLEFRFLNQLARKRGVDELLDNFNSLSFELTRDVYKDGLVPATINWDTNRVVASNVSFGTLGGTYYEYQLKQWLQTGKRNDALKQGYLQAIKGLQEKMIDHTSPSGLPFIGLLPTNGTLKRMMDHASCFMPGLLALGFHHGLPEEHLKLAKELMETCVQMYLRSASMLAAEVVHFSQPSATASFSSEFTVSDRDDVNNLGPETVESLMVLYRVTKEDKYRQYGRMIMNAFENHSKVPTGGYRSLRHVFAGVSEPYASTMESSFLSETLKYLFLLFTDDGEIQSLDKIVFNTRGHGFPISL